MGYEQLHAEHYRKCLEAIPCTCHPVRKIMSELRSIDIRTSSDSYQIKVVVLGVKNYSGVVRKLKGKNVIAIVKLDEASFMAFIEE